MLAHKSLKKIILETDDQIITIVRAESQENAILRLKRTFWETNEVKDQIGKRITVLNGDLSAPQMNLPDSEYEFVVKNTTHIIHSAANVTPNLPLEELQKINVTGTANVIELAKKINADHGLKKLSHISTAFVSGQREGIIGEDDLTDKYGFSSVYEKTKYQSELLMNEAKSSLPVSIFRLGLVVGDSKTGEIKTFNTVYYLLKLYLTGHLRTAPVSPSLKVFMVPVDYVADMVVKLTSDDQANGLNFHVTPPLEKAPTASELFQFVRDWAKQNMDLDLPKVIFAPTLGKTTASYLSLMSHFSSSAKKSKSAFETLTPYFSQNKDFKRENTDRLMGKYNLNWEDFTGNLLQYGVRYSFFHRSERTVHEQILFRLQSETKPVTYHEIVNGKLVTYETKKVKEEILSAVAAMKNMGVQKGDTVAIITPNTLRYLIVDVATGLLGAILSPIYLTTPISEIKKILTDTKAKIFFVGSNKLLEQITYAQITIPIVSLLKQPFDSQKSNQAVPWSEFLSNGGNAKAPAMAPVAFDDLATIRFTYGSTGDSKGACLEQGNLRYLGEAIATNFNWKARNSAIRYLSFLPLNHVAEGIGAAYSFYYVPAKLDFYYLEEYKSLQKALRMAKPTIFFTIPRFYEKLWASILANPMGKRYVKNKRGLKKSVLKRAVRKSLLDKTGLNECVEFYTGSACMSEILVDNFKELGIEIQNAYGLSEAPIVAMNRPGGRSDAVGTPLVGTHIRIDDDGEVLIKGPQVMRGYLNVEKGRQPFRDGWLATGDLGELTEDGYLKITGRKKHLIVTAYGKKIPVDKIEASLRTIDSVKDALFVGENQPYCSAILWVDRNAPYDKSKMLRAIEEINKGLETPAQIKKIEILEDDYSKVDEGLKTKRQVLSQKAEKAINILYSTKTEPS